jgi:hypothetical protein
MVNELVAHSLDVRQLDAGSDLITNRHERGIADRVGFRCRNRSPLASIAGGIGVGDVVSDDLDDALICLQSATGEFNSTECPWHSKPPACRMVTESRSESVRAGETVAGNAVSRA